MKTEIKGESRVLSGMTPGQIREKVKELSGEIGKRYAEIGEFLLEISDRALYKDWGYDNLDDYMVSEVKIAARTGYYAMSVVKNFKQAGVPTSAWLGIDWTKAREVSRVVTKENANKLLERAKKADVRTLEVEVRDIQNQRREEVGKEPLEKFYTVKLFLAEQQYNNWNRAMESAHKATGSSKPAFWADCMAMEFLARGFDERGDALQYWISELERVYNVKLFAVDLNNENAEEAIKDLEDISSNGSTKTG